MNLNRFYYLIGAYFAFALSAFGQKSFEAAQKGYLEDHTKDESNLFTILWTINSYWFFIMVFVSIVLLAVAWIRWQTQRDYVGVGACLLGIIGGFATPKIVFMIWGLFAGGS